MRLLIGCLLAKAVGFPKSRGSFIMTQTNCINAWHYHLGNDLPGIDMPSTTDPPKCFLILQPEGIRKNFPFDCGRALLFFSSIPYARTVISFTFSLSFAMTAPIGCRAYVLLVTSRATPRFLRGGTRCCPLETILSSFLNSCCCTGRFILFWRVAGAAG